MINEGARIVLRDERAAGDQRSLGARLSDEGDLLIEGHDGGTSVQSMLGCSEYEWMWTVRSNDLPVLAAALAKAPRHPAPLLEALRMRFSGEAAADVETEEKPVGKTRYLAMLNWAFVAFNSTRVLTYLPTLWAIHVSGDSSQHSLLTWLSWVGANVSMAALLYENNGRRVNKVIGMNIGNALMCVVTCSFIVWYRRS